MNRKRLKEKILFTGGGSGGHVSAATAIISGIRSQYEMNLDQILYIGSDLTMEGESDGKTKGKSHEEKILSTTDIPYRSIRAGKLQRYLSFRSFKLLFGILGGFIDSWKVISEFQPDRVVSTGGYVTVPICIVAKIRGIPVYIHEQTAVVGLTNKIVGKFAKRIYISFISSASFFPRERTLHTGNAVRPEIFNTTGEGPAQQAIRKMLPNSKKYPIVLIAGGGQGSHLLNITVRQMLTYLTEEFQVVLQTGDNQVHKDHEILWKDRLKLPADKQDRFFPVKFITAEEIGNVFSNTDIFVGRSGANFTYEMGVLQIPSILIPIPWVTHNEQMRNAQALEETGLARIIPEGELTAERLFNELRRLSSIINKGTLKIDEEKLHTSFPINAVSTIINDLTLNSEPI